MQKFKLISQSFLKPRIVTHNAPHNLRTIDLIPLTVNPMKTGLLFDKKPDNLLSRFLPTLKNSVSLSLVDFYTLSGRFVTQKFPKERACSLYIDCTAGPGARFIHACMEYKISDFISSHDVHPMVGSLFDLGEESINHDGHTRPLLSVQVTELVDGIFIGFTMNHCVADGTSFWHFISTLSEIFGQLKVNDRTDVFKNENDLVPISKKPFLGPVFTDREYGPITKLPYLEPEEFIIRYDPGPLRVRIFRFSSKSISTLKARANEDCGFRNDITSFQALSGLIWRSITRARKFGPDVKVEFCMAMNARARLDPPLAPEYFRSFYMAPQCESKAGDLLRNGLGRAALLVNQIIKAHDDEGTRRVLKQYEEHPFIYRPNPRLSYNNDPKTTIFVAGSSRFDVYGPEFGLGKAVAILSGPANMDDGQLLIIPGREGGGSVDLKVCLSPETMNALELDDEFIGYVTN